jgi:hypothetical protein
MNNASPEVISKAKLSKVAIKEPKFWDYSLDYWGFFLLVLALSLRKSEKWGEKHIYWSLQLPWFIFLFNRTLFFFLLTTILSIASLMQWNPCPPNVCNFCDMQIGSTQRPAFPEILPPLTKVHLPTTHHASFQQSSFVTPPP